ncbi:MAG: RNA polymerase sigma factor [Chitinophagaceae bacterium]
MHFTDYEIQELLKGCIANKRQSQQIFYSWLKDYAVAICYPYAGNKQDLEDLVAEGFLKVFKNIHLYNNNLYGTSAAAFKAWFKRVLINNAISILKKEKHFHYKDASEVEMLMIEDNCTGILDHLSYKEIVEAIKQLPPAYRTVFNLYVMEGMPHEDIAELLGINAGTSRSNLFKAKEILKKTLNKKMNYRKNA